MRTFGSVSVLEGPGIDDSRWEEKTATSNVSDSEIRPSASGLIPEAVYNDTDMMHSSVRSDTAC